MSEIRRKYRPGDQPLPVPNDGRSMHDLVGEDLVAMWPPRQVAVIIGDLQARKRLGLERYGSLLQAHNGRSALRDLYEELLDAAVYAKQVQEETVAAQRRLDIDPVYLDLLGRLTQVRRLLDEHS